MGQLVGVCLAAVDFLDVAMLVLGQAPPAGVLWCWELMAVGAGVLDSSSVALPRKLARSDGNGGMSPRLSLRSN